MTTMYDKFGLEWSRTRNAFLVRPLREIIETNRSHYLDDVASLSDYRLLHLGTEAECNLLAQNCQATLDSRQPQEAGA